MRNNLERSFLSGFRVLTTRAMINSRAEEMMYRNSRSFNSIGIANYNFLPNGRKTTIV
jgi:hypothetical protein